ncbi:type II toxin-antitoxin system RelE/ParE family toxin [Sorangium sp. So ce295]|uniref:type II toxin-antitoxin system RelE/ParE family toxin n=1 Tax=Sorangium sp. So ce295 TaxID=3133295 RepID=UPI003F5DA42A
MPAALAEAEEAAAWYAERDPRIAARFAEEIEAALNRIAEAPDRWPTARYGTRRVRLTRFPYVVVYRDESTRILVVAIAHAKQRPGYWRKR